MQWCCQLLQSVAKSRAEFYFVQRFAQQKNCETTHVTLSNYPATCLVMALRDKLLRKLHSVTDRAFSGETTKTQVLSVFLVCFISSVLAKTISQIEQFNLFPSKYAKLETKLYVLRLS